jgi:hypothetical protein
MPRNRRSNTKRPIESYEHRDKQRVNNPPVGLVTPQTDPDAGHTRVPRNQARLAETITTRFALERSFAGSTFLIRVALVGAFDLKKNGDGYATN